MHGLILAAGRGSRLENLTDEHPKCMTPVFGKPMLSWQLDAFEKAGLGVPAVVAGYMSDKINYIGMRKFNNSRWQFSNMVESLRCADEWLASDETIVSYSDLIYNSETLISLSNCKSEFAITYDPNWLQLWKMRFDNPLDDAESFQKNTDGSLKSIGKKNPEIHEVEGQYMGLLKISTNGWRKISSYLNEIDAAKRDGLDMTSLINILLNQNVLKIDTVPVLGNWYEVDNPHDVDVYEKIVQARNGRIF